LPFTNLGSHSFFYERQGAGAPLLLIGGTGGDLRRPETRFAGPLTRHFDVLAYDQRGLGQSWKGDGPFTMADYADDAARLMDWAGWDDAHVVGVSFGGIGGTGTGAAASGQGAAADPVLHGLRRRRRIVFRLSRTSRDDRRRDGGV